MINVLFVVPYPDLESNVYKVYREGSFDPKLNLKVAVKTVDQLESLNQEHDIKSFDVLVARGYSAIRLKKLYPEIPVIAIDITAYDIIQSIYYCKEKYNAKKIALIGEFSRFHNLELLQKVLNCEIKLFYTKGKDIKNAIRFVISQGYEAIVGGYSVILESEALNHPAGLIETGVEAVQIALNEAQNIGDALNLEREKSQMFKNVTESATDGIIYIKKVGDIEILNQTGEKILEQFNPIDNSLNILEQIDFIKDGFKKIVKNQTERDSSLYSNNDITLSVDYLPVVIQDQVEGAVIHFQNVTEIQELENKIRKKLSNKGLNAKYTFDDILYESKEMDIVVKQALSYAKVDSNVIIFGESGTGKELIAHSIHNKSSRKLKPFVAINCAAIPENLLESELFGYAEGAFTNAKKDGKMGLFELAHNGTLFLDEISELPIDFQSKLLRAIQEKEIRRVGDNKTITVNVRIIAATNINLNRLAKEGKFRLDLLYRLDVLRIHVPPLRKRKKDLRVLFFHFLRNYEKKYGSIKGITEDALKYLEAYDYPGNIRELQNIVERTVVLYRGKTIQKEDIKKMIIQDEIEIEPIMEKYEVNDNKSISFYELQERNEKEILIHALEKNGYNRKETAKALGIDRSTLWRRMKKYNIL